jgi:peroxiredoxin (alkyl hydroperoxide reductase subunit C)
MPAPEVGSPAPDFALTDHEGQEFRLSDLRGHSAVLLVFYPFAFSGTCTGELCALRDDLGTFRTAGVQVVGVSCDPRHALRVWAAQEGYDFPLLSDFWPHGEVARLYDVFFEPAGMATRGTFLVDREGVLRWSVVNGPGEARDLDSYREAVRALSG